MLIPAHMPLLVRLSGCITNMMIITHGCFHHQVVDLEDVAVADIAAGGWHSMALSADGEIYVWGRCGAEEAQRRPCGKGCLAFFECSASKLAHLHLPCCPKTPMKCGIPGTFLLCAHHALSSQGGVRPAGHCRPHRQQQAAATKGSRPGGPHCRTSGGRRHALAGGDICGPHVHLGPRQLWPSGLGSRCKGRICAGGGSTARGA